MQRTPRLTSLLREFISVVEQEAAQNPAFAERLASVLDREPDLGRPQARPKPAAVQVPDIMAALQQKGEEEFRFWLRSLDLLTLKAAIKANGFDPGKTSRGWTDCDKLVGLIAEQAVARLRRGSAFLPAKATDADSSEK